MKWQLPLNSTLDTCSPGARSTRDGMGVTPGCDPGGVDDRPGSRSHPARTGEARTLDTNTCSWSHGRVTNARSICIGRVA